MDVHVSSQFWLHLLSMPGFALGLIALAGLCAKYIDSDKTLVVLALYCWVSTVIFSVNTRDINRQIEEAEKSAAEFVEGRVRNKKLPHYLSENFKSKSSFEQRPDIPPAQFRGPTHTIIQTVPLEEVSAYCRGFDGYTSACHIDRSGIIVPNPCNEKFREEYYARLMCHELGHSRGWGGDHKDGEEYLRKTHQKPKGGATQ